MKPYRFVFDIVPTLWYIFQLFHSTGEVVQLREGGRDDFNGKPR